MDIMTDSDFRKRIKFGADDKTPRKFFFYGDEDYLKHAAVEAAKQGCVADPQFDFCYIGSADYSEEALLSALAVPPMFSAVRLVVLSLSFADLRQGEVNSLIDIISDIDNEGYTLFILSLPSGSLDPGTPKKPSSVFKKLCEAATPVVFDRVTGARLNGWVSKHYSIHGLSAETDVCAYTVSYCGTDMFRLAGEIDKVACYALSQGRDKVTKEDIKTAGCTAEEFDSFALSNAIVAGNHRLALDVLAYAKTQKTDPVLIMSEIIRVLCDMSAADACRRSGLQPSRISEITGIKPYPLSIYLSALEKTDPKRLRRALTAARTADAGVKGGTKDYIAIEQLICSM